MRSSRAIPRPSVAGCVNAGRRWVSGPVPQRVGTAPCGLRRRGLLSQLKVNPTHSAESPLKAIPFVDLQAQYRSIAADLRGAVEQVLSSCNFVLGQPVEDFEEEFAEFIGVGHAVGVSSG